MLRKCIFFISVLLFAGTAHADYKFNYFSISASSITDDSLGAEIDANSLGYTLTREMGNKFLVRGGISVTGYDETRVNGVFFDGRSTSAGVSVGKYIEVNNNKLVGYLGVRANKTEFVVDTLKEETDDTGLVGGLGFITPLSDSFDFLLSLDVDTLYDDTDTSTSIGGSYDLSDYVSFEASYYTADYVDAFTIEVRFNYL